MRLTIFTLALAFIVNACNLFNGSSYDNTRLPKQLLLLDTLGNQNSSFRSGEEFQLRFTLTNETGRDLSYHYTGVPVVLLILQGDNIVATSTDGYAFLDVVVSGKLIQGRTITYSWRAPNTAARQPKITLQPGQYVARVEHGSFFDEFQAPKTNDVPFTVTP